MDIGGGALGDKIEATVHTKTKLIGQEEEGSERRHHQTQEVGGDSGEGGSANAIYNKMIILAIS